MQIIYFQKIYRKILEKNRNLKTKIFWIEKKI